MELTNEQQKAFEKLWFIYGNDGKKCTPLNHTLIQGFVEYNEDRREFCKDGYKNMIERYGKKEAKARAATDECFEICALILDGKIEEAFNIAKS